MIYTIIAVWIALLTFPVVSILWKWNIVIRLGAFLVNRRKGAIQELRYLASFVIDAGKRDQIEKTLDVIPADCTTVDKYRARINAIICEQFSVLRAEKRRQSC